MTTGHIDLMVHWSWRSAVESFPSRVSAFLAPLLPQGLSCLSLHMWHNGAAVDFQLVNCFNGFFVQVTVGVNSILLENILLAAPLIIPQLHIDDVVLADPQLLHVTSFVPGGDTLISSRSLTMIERRDRVFTIKMVVRNVLRGSRTSACELSHCDTSDASQRCVSALRG